MLISSVILLLFVDILVSCTEGRYFNNARRIVKFLNSLFLFLQILPVFTWMTYCDTVFLSDSRFPHFRVSLYCIPVIVCMVCTVCNVRYGFIFRIDSRNMYLRGPVYVPYMTAMVLFVIVDCVFIYRKYRMQDIAAKLRNKPLLFFPILPLAATILQCTHPGIELTWNSFTISVIYIFIEMQNNQIFTDELSGLNNRRRLYQYLAVKISNLQERQELYAIFCDIDGFKMINDRFGHATGDGAIVEVADVLKKSCGPGSFVARTGGDEFVILVTGSNDHCVVDLMDRINGYLGELNLRPNIEYRLAISMGYSRYNKESNDSIDHFLSVADRNMYIVKRHKKGLDISGL